MRLLVLAWLLLLTAAPAAGQTVTAERFQFKTGPCTLRSGSGSPEGAVAGQICDTFWRTDTGQIYTKTSGTGTTGWTLPGGVSGSGTTNSIAKWTNSSTIGNASITDDAATVTVMPTGNVIFNNGGDIVFNPTGNDLLPTTGYDLNIGALTNKFLTLHAAELWVETLVAQSTMATIGGRILVAPTTIAIGDIGLGDTTLVFKHNNLAIGDRIYMESDSKVEFMAITAGPAAGSGGYEYGVTRNLDGSGANLWYAGDAVLNTGTTGDGFIDLYSVRGVRDVSEEGPTIVGNVRNSATYNDWSPRWAIGNLNGLYGYSGSTYGSVFGTPSGARVTIDATNGIRIYGGDNDEKVTIDTAGNATFDGRITVGTGLNLIRNSECRVSTDDYAVTENTGLTPTFTFNQVNFRLLGESSTCALSIAGTPANGTVSNILGVSYAAKATQVYEASVYLANYRHAGSFVTIEFLDAGAASLATAGGNTCTTAAAGGASLNDYCRSTVIATAPANTYAVRFRIQTNYNGTEANPVTFFVRSYLGEGKVGQTQITEWGPAGLTEIIGGLIKTDAIDARTIAADTITANEIAANAITTSELNADSVTSDKIAANTIVAGDIAADTITASQIASSTITGGEIAATTITGGNIATNTITADRLSVTELSAITANVGTLTAGTIDGVTVRAGSGDEVTLDSSGISIGSGSGTGNKIKWGNSQEIFGLGDGDLWIDALSGAINLVASGAAGGVNVTGGLSTAGLVVNSGNFWLANLAGSGNRYLCIGDTEIAFASGSACTAPPAPEPLVETLQQQIDVLKQELAALRAELAALRLANRDHP